MAEVEAETGVGHTTMHRWRTEVPERLYPGTRRKVVASLVARGILPADPRPEGPATPDFADSPADELIWAFSHPAILATHSHLTRRQRIELVTTWAEEHPETFPDSELAKVYEWARIELSRDPGKA